MNYKFTLTALTHMHAVLIESLTIFLIYSNGLIVILKFNPTKTESSFLLLSLRSNNLPTPSCTSGNIVIPYSKHVRNIGVQLDSELSMYYQISNMHKTIDYHLYSIRSIRFPLLLSFHPPIYYLSLTTAIIYSSISHI